MFWAASRSTSTVRYSSLSLTDRAPRSWRVRLSKLPAVLMAVAIVSLAVALAGPRTPDAETKVSREGIAIMMVVDRSGSMQARDLVKDDLSVDRLAVVKDVFQEFVLGGEAGHGRPDDAIGLVAFAGYADSLCPLTLDHGNLVSMVADLEIVKRRDEDGTALGDGLALAIERLRRSKAKSKVAILLTDGVNNTGSIAPDQAAELAVTQGIKVYCIGAGTEGLAPFPAIEPFSGRQGPAPYLCRDRRGDAEGNCQRDRRPLLPRDRPGTGLPKSTPKSIDSNEPKSPKSSTSNTPNITSSSSSAP